MDTAFETLGQLGADGLIIIRDAFFQTRIEQFAALSVRYAMPTIFQDRAFAVAGGLMSYSSSDRICTVRLASTPAGFLKGDKPADLPVVQSTKVELVINLKTAKALGLNVPNTLIGRADEVIE